MHRHLCKRYSNSSNVPEVANPKSRSNMHIVTCRRQAHMSVARNSSTSVTSTC
jgi:hypothetical protein